MFRVFLRKSQFPLHKTTRARLGGVAAAAKPLCTWSRGGGGRGGMDPCVDQKKKKEDEEREGNLQRKRRRRRRRIGVYVHWPYCERLCPYCDFNKYVVEEPEYERMEECMIKELGYFMDRVERGGGGSTRGVGDSSSSSSFVFSSVYFGGGTPSLARPELIRKITAQVRSHNRRNCYTDEIEVTLEANPTRLELEKLSAFKAAGINRLSLGIQSLVDEDLNRLGRNHTSQEAVEVLQGAYHEIGFPRGISVDLMYAREGQTCKDWLRELLSLEIDHEGTEQGERGRARRRRLLDCVDHISLYELTPKPGTPFGRAVMKAEAEKNGDGEGIELPSEDERCEMYEETQKWLEREDIGFQRYEVSNYARKGSEFATVLRSGMDDAKGENEDEEDYDAGRIVGCGSVHNRGYWEGREYFGIGPGAHGRIEYPLTVHHECDHNGVVKCVGVRERRRQVRSPRAWMRRVEAIGHGSAGDIEEITLGDDFDCASNDTVEEDSNGLSPAYFPVARNRRDVNVKGKLMGKKLKSGQGSGSLSNQIGVMSLRETISEFILMRMRLAEGIGEYAFRDFISRFVNLENNMETDKETRSTTDNECGSSISLSSLQSIISSGDTVPYSGASTADLIKEGLLRFDTRGGGGKNGNKERFLYASSPRGVLVLDSVCAVIINDVNRALHHSYNSNTM